MKLLINPEGGMSGDMFSAALISAGADFDMMRKYMLGAGEKLGTALIEVVTAHDSSTQLRIDLKPKHEHLSANEARNIISELFYHLDVPKKYRELGMNILEILIKAEKRAHKEFHIVIEPSHHHDHQHHDQSLHTHEHIHDPHHDHHSHEHEHDHDHDHHRKHSHNGSEESFLHEAQDIVIDVMGAVAGMLQLEIEPEAELLCPVSVGGGHVHCSHGVLNVPAPAVSVILEEYNLEWKKGPIEKELFTPTGAAILAALDSKLNPSIDLNTLNIVARGKSRGSKILEISPMEVILYK